MRIATVGPWKYYSVKAFKEVPAGLESPQQVAELSHAPFSKPHSNLNRSPVRFEGHELTAYEFLR